MQVPQSRSVYPTTSTSILYIVEDWNERFAELRPLTATRPLTPPPPTAEDARPKIDRPPNCDGESTRGRNQSESVREPVHSLMVRRVDSPDLLKQRTPPSSPKNSTVGNDLLFQRLSPLARGRRRRPALARYEYCHCSCTIWLRQICSIVAADCLPIGWKKYPPCNQATNGSDGENFLQEHNGSFTCENLPISEMDYCEPWRCHRTINTAERATCLVIVYLFLTILMLYMLCLWLTWSWSNWS